MSQSAVQKLIVNDQHFLPGDITTGFVTDSFVLGGAGTLEIYYQKVGNLYFNFNNNIVPAGALTGIICDDGLSNATNAARIAALIGVTVNTIYTVTADVTAGANTGKRITYNGANWIDNGVATGTILYAFLAN